MAPSKRPTTRPTTSPKPKAPAKKPAGIKKSMDLRKRAKTLIEQAKQKALEKLKPLKNIGGRLPGRGYNAWREVVEKQKREITKEALNALRKSMRITRQTSKSKEALNTQLTEVVNKYQNQMDITVKSMISILDSVLNGRQYLTPKALEKFLRLQRTFRAKIQLEITKDPKLRSEITQLMRQLREGKPLTKPQLTQLSKMANEINIDKLSTLENTKIGLFLYLMIPSQRTQFVREIISSPKNAKKAPKIIDTLTKLGILSVRQGEVLMKEALSKPAIKNSIKRTLREKFLRDFANGTYNRIQNKSLAQQRKTAQQFAQNFHENAAHRYLNFTSGLGFIAIIWGALTAALNMIVNKGRINKQALWGFAAIAGGIMAVQKGSQTDRRYSGALDPIGFDSPFTSFTRYLAFHEKTKSEFKLKKAFHLQTMANIYNNKPLHQYMQEGGFKTWYDEFQGRKRGQSHLKNENIYRGITSKNPKFQYNKHFNVKYVDYDALINLERKKASKGKKSNEALLKRSLDLMPGLTPQQKKNSFNQLLRNLERTSSAVPSLSTQSGYDGAIGEVRKAYGINK